MVSFLIQRFFSFPKSFFSNCCGSWGFLLFCLTEMVGLLEYIIFAKFHLANLKANWSDRPGFSLYLESFLENFWGKNELDNSVKLLNIGQYIGAVSSYSLKYFHVKQVTVLICSAENIKHCWCTYNTRKSA